MWQINNQPKFDQQAFDHAEERVYHALICAYHDLVDGIVMDLTAVMNKLAEEYPEAALDVLGSSWVEILDFINEVDEKIAESREKLLERKKIYDEELYDRWYASLLRYRKQMTRTILPKVVDKHNSLKEQQRKSKNRNRLMMSIGIIGALIGVVSIVLSLVALT